VSEQAYPRGEFRLLTATYRPEQAQRRRRLSFEHREDRVMRKLAWAAVVVLMSLLSAVSAASPYKEDEEEEGHFTSPTYRYFATQEAAAAAMQRDLKYVDEMTRHHQGAVDMSLVYLDDPRGTNLSLQRMARAIIFNQQFEIAWLEDIKRRESVGPQSVFGLSEVVQLPTGLTGFEHRARFQKAPVLSITQPVRAQRPSDYDVMFAKAMKMHHEMALDMAHAYNNHPIGENRVIREINRGILRDQAFEIGILSDLIAQYPGNPDAIEVPPEMHEMMGMPHGS
jgi:uncharacterized protein (DUF305 family)